MDTTTIPLLPTVGATVRHAERLGLRFGDKGTHTSRTMMLEELSALLAATPPSYTRKDYAAAIIEENVLAKSTLSTRKLSNQRLGELYGLDVTVGVFRVLRRLWNAEQPSRPLLSLLCAVARDPLLAATVPAVISLADGQDFARAQARSALRDLIGTRLNDSVLDKVLRNAASSWAQSGHLEGRTFKKRQRVVATARSMAFALYLGRAVGFRSADVFSSGWVAMLDVSPAEAKTLSLEAKRLGLIDISISADIVDLSLDRLDPIATRI